MQSAKDVLFTLRVLVFALQDVHVAWPTVALCVPRPHRVHAALPTVSLKDPAGQGTAGLPAMPT